ncbi:hypothetical protein [Methylobacterium sp. WL7]|uniref:hypothetical protein n=1 Tax=Methylobacterium sp. WL7 TaxID=2603900 RepID=UPI0011C9E8C1|nr:hypothetical protein [Methylobacterium sp. WL7]TXN40508.1 hypothetical protein FV233_26570 [Methylobacterium sp. WL7]
MTAILSSSVSCRTLVDGSLRLQVDIEPKDAQAAFALFGKPGAPVALALISNSAAVEHDRKAQAQPPAEPLERKPLSLASKVALTCRQPSFHAFLKDRDEDRWLHRPDDRPELLPEIRARFFVCIECGVQSRSDITEGSRAARVWADLEASYHHWQRTGAAA